MRASIDLEGKRVWSWALRNPNVRDQVEEGNTVRENERSEAGGTLGKCGVREVVMGMCCFCCPVFSPFLVATAPQICFQRITLFSFMSQVNSPLGPEVEHLTKV